MRTANHPPSFIRNILRGFCVWGLGWLVFAIIEAVLIIIRSPDIHCSVVVLTTTGYAIAGAIGGMIIACIQHFSKSRRKNQNSFSAEIGCYSGCITSILLFAGLAILGNKLLLKAHLPAILSLSLVYCVLCACVYLLLVRLFSRIPSREKLRRVLCALYLSLSALLLAGLFINESLLPGKFLDLTPQRLMANGAIIVGCAALFFIIFWLLKVLERILTSLSLPGSVSYFILLSIVITLGISQAVLKTNKDNVTEEIATIIAVAKFSTVTPGNIQAVIRTAQVYTSKRMITFMLQR